MDDQKDRNRREDYFGYRPGDLTVVSTLCETCAYRIQDDPSCCRKYPEGKPMAVLDPDYYCPAFSVVELSL